MMDDILGPRESGAYIAENSNFVSICELGIKGLAEKIITHFKDGTLQTSEFPQCPIHPSFRNEKAIEWIFVVDSLNYCFWSATSQKWSVTWNNITYTGYFALCAAINRALDEGYPITDPQFCAKVSLEDLKKIFKGDDVSTCIPLLHERQKCLHEVGQVLLQKFDGSFKNCIEASENSAEKLLQIIVQNFNCYRDECLYNSVKVSFYKRAQILIGDIWTTFHGKGLGYFKDIEKLTMFADYRIPQVLVYFKALQYSQDLMERLKKDEILKYGSQEEVEIRGCSIHAVELLMNEIQTLLHNVKSNVDVEKGSYICNAVVLDNFLWSYRRMCLVFLCDLTVNKMNNIMQDLIMWYGENSRFKQNKQKLNSFHGSAMSGFELELL